MHQSVTLVGYLGKDPEQRFTPQGTAVASFSVATSRKYKGESETTWWRVSVWGNQAEACATYLHKGDPVLVVGRLTPDPETGNPRIWKHKDGTPDASYEISAQSVKFLPGGSGEVESEEVPF